MERFFKTGILTTLLGLIILLFAGVLLYQQKTSATDLGGWITVGILFLRSKDSILFGTPKNNDDLNEK